MVRSQQASTPSYLSAYHEEHGWRQQGEQAIREEMERRLNVYFLRKSRKVR